MKTIEYIQFKPFDLIRKPELLYHIGRTSLKYYNSDNASEKNELILMTITIIFPTNFDIYSEADFKTYLTVL